MLLPDFTHSKVHAPFKEDLNFEGTIDGKPVPPTAQVGDYFKKLEWTHGHNMLTLNGFFVCRRLELFRHTSVRAPASRFRTRKFFGRAVDLEPMNINIPAPSAKPSSVSSFA